MLKRTPKTNAAAAANNADTAATARPRPAGPRFTLKPSKKTCMALGGTMGALLLASAGLYFWQSGEIAALDKQVQDKQTQLAESEKIARDLEQVRQKNTDTRSQLRFLETSVTEGQYVPTLLHQTEDLAKSTNLQVAAIRPTLEPAPKPPADKEQAKKFKPQPYDKILIDMEVSGKYWDIAHMLYRLTEFPKILTVESMQVSPSNPIAGTAPSLTVKMKLTGFIFPNDGKVHGPGDSPAAAPGRTSGGASGSTAAQSTAPANVSAKPSA